MVSLKTRGLSQSFQVRVLGFRAFTHPDLLCPRPQSRCGQLNSGPKVSPPSSQPMGVGFHVARRLSRCGYTAVAEPKEMAPSLSRWFYADSVMGGTTLRRCDQRAET